MFIGILSKFSTSFEEKKTVLSIERKNNPALISSFRNST